MNLIHGGAERFMTFASVEQLKAAPRYVDRASVTPAWAEKVEAYYRANGVHP
jgi:hypothetical protein